MLLVMNFNYLWQKCICMIMHKVGLVRVLFYYHQCFKNLHTKLRFLVLMVTNLKVVIFWDVSFGLIVLTDVSEALTASINGTINLMMKE